MGSVGFAASLPPARWVFSISHCCGHRCGFPRKILNPEPPSRSPTGSVPPIGKSASLGSQAPQAPSEQPMSVRALTVVCAELFSVLLRQKKTSMRSLPKVSWCYWSSRWLEEEILPPGKLWLHWVAAMPCTMGCGDAAGKSCSWCVHGPCSGWKKAKAAQRAQGKFQQPVTPPV